MCCGQAKNEEGRNAGTSWLRKPYGNRPPALAADQTRSAALVSPGPHSGRNPIPRDSHREAHLGFCRFLKHRQRQHRIPRKKVSDGPTPDISHPQPPNQHIDKPEGRIPGSSGIILGRIPLLARCYIDFRFHITYEYQPTAARSFFSVGEKDYLISEARPSCWRIFLKLDIDTQNRIVRYSHSNDPFSSTRPIHCAAIATAPCRRASSAVYTNTRRPACSR